MTMRLHALDWDWLAVEMTFLRGPVGLYQRIIALNFVSAAAMSPCNVTLVELSI